MPSRFVVPPDDHAMSRDPVLEGVLPGEHTFVIVFHGSERQSMSGLFVHVAHEIDLD